MVRDANAFKSVAAGDLPFVKQYKVEGIPVGQALVIFQCLQVVLSYHPAQGFPGIEVGEYFNVTFSVNDASRSAMSPLRIMKGRH